jgi:hypothetical protein
VYNRDKCTPNRRLLLTALRPQYSDHNLFSITEFHAASLLGVARQAVQSEDGGSVAIRGEGQVVSKAATLAMALAKWLGFLKTNGAARKSNLADHQLRNDCLANQTIHGLFADFKAAFLFEAAAFIGSRTSDHFSKIG